MKSDSIKNGLSTQKVNIMKVKNKIKSRKAVEAKLNGLEPIIVGEATENQLTYAFNYYNYTYDVKQAKKWLLEYLKKDKRNAKLLSEIRSAPDWQTVTTAGWMARMMLNGTVFSELYMTRFEERVRLNALYGVKDTETVEEPKTVVSIQDRVKRVNAQMLADAEVEVIDERKPMYDFLQSRQATPVAAKKMLEYYQPILDELMSDDDQIKEAYGKKLKDERAFMQSVVDDLNRYIGNKKVVKVRKPREKKVKSAIDLVKKVKYQKEFPPLKIVSVNPTEIIGATQVWTYNTKYKKLTRYNSLGPSGIQVKGTTLIGFDVESSLTKSLRKPDGIIQSLLGAGKVSLRNFMNEIKTNETKPTGRLNEDTVILRVIK